MLELEKNLGGTERQSEGGTLYPLLNPFLVYQKVEIFEENWRSNDCYF